VLSVRGDAALRRRRRPGFEQRFRALVAQRAEQRFGRRFQAFLRAEQARGNQTALQRSVDHLRQHGGRHRIRRVIALLLAAFEQLGQPASLM
jgi:hypothetical protein